MRCELARTTRLISMVTSRNLTSRIDSGDVDLLQTLKNILVIVMVCCHSMTEMRYILFIN